MPVREEHWTWKGTHAGEGAGATQHMAELSRQPVGRVRVYFEALTCPRPAVQPERQELSSTADNTV